VPNPVSIRQPLPAPESRDPAVLVDVLVLSADLLLFDAIRGAIGERNPVWRARSAEEAVDLMLTGRCGVLLVDMAAVTTTPTALVGQIVEQFPDVVVVVAGRREDESLLAQLITNGCVYRFMHKPLTAKRAGMFLQAAIRRHVELRESRPATQPLLPSARTLPVRLDLWKWMFVLAGVTTFVALLWLFVGGGWSRISSPPTPERAPAAAPAASQAQPLADSVLSRARAAFAAGRYEAPSGRNALDLYAAVLLARPDQAEARAGLDRTIDHIVSLARLAEADGNHTEARRLLARVESTDASNLAVTRLAAFLAPPPPVAAVPAAPAVNPPSVPTVHRLVPVPPALPATKIADPADASPPVIRPDPLTPTVVNAGELRAASLRARRGARPARVFRAPAAHVLPTAGYAGAVEPKAPASDRPAPAMDPATVAALAMPADELGRVHATDPVYPPTALRDHVEGWVELMFTITETGSVRDIEVVDSAPRGVFESAASAALENWRYRPRLSNGQAVAHRTTVTLRFNLDD
jgi:TonB family protein